MYLVSTTYPALLGGEDIAMKKIKKISAFIELIF